MFSEFLIATYTLFMQFLIATYTLFMQMLVRCANRYEATLLAADAALLAEQRAREARADVIKCCSLVCLTVVTVVLHVF
jgi:hypothetical protein